MDSECVNSVSEFRAVHVLFVCGGRCLAFGRSVNILLSTQCTSL